MFCSASDIRTSRIRALRSSSDSHCGGLVQFFFIWFRFGPSELPSSVWDCPTYNPDLQIIWIHQSQMLELQFFFPTILCSLCLLHLPFRVTADKFFWFWFYWNPENMTKSERSRGEPENSWEILSSDWQNQNFVQNQNSSSAARLLLGEDSCLEWGSVLLS